MLSRERKVQTEPKVRRAQIKNYLNGLMTLKQKKKLENEIGSCKHSQILLEKEIERRNIFNQMTPEFDLSPERRSSLRRSLIEINREILDVSDEETLKEKAMRILNMRIF